MQRRALLNTLAGVGAGMLAGSRLSVAADAEIELTPSDTGPEISPHIYGHFIEHLGGVIYDGIWIGEDSKIADVRGLRRRFVDDMKGLRAPNIRWPGGCFADGYHWRDGVGAREKRPRTATYWGADGPPALKGAEPNWFGTHEFLQLCRLTGAAPYLAANMTTGSPQEFHDWIGYCNASAGSVSLADERTANGNQEPFRVKYWGIGNEAWGCGGNMQPAEYLSLYKRFAAQLPSGDPLFLVACGPRGHSSNNGVDWTRGLFESLAGSRRVPMSGLSMHFYTDFRPTTVPSDSSTPEQWHAAIAAGARIETSLLDNWKVMTEYDPQHRIKFVVDEWGPWYSHNPKSEPGFTLAQTVTLRDAAVTALHFDIFNRHADKIAMANVAQTINCLNSLFLAHEDRYVRTPVYHVFNLYKAHMGGRALSVKNIVGVQDTNQVSASASVQNKRLTLSMTNFSTQDALNIRVRIKGTSQLTEGTGLVLTHPELAATNTFANPNEVKPLPLSVKVTNNIATVLLPKQAVACLQFQLS